MWKTHNVLELTIYVSKTQKAVSFTTDVSKTSKTHKTLGFTTNVSKTHKVILTFVVKRLYPHLW